MTKQPSATLPDMRPDFPLLERTVYLDTAAEGLLPPCARESLEAYLEHKSQGRRGRALLYETEYEARAAAGALLGVAPENVAFLSSASEGLNLLANSIPWRPGDEVLLNDLEFPSNVLPWLRQRERGAAVRVVRSQAGALRREQFLAEITSRTRVISLSFVSYVNGAKVSFLEDLAQAAEAAGAILCLDATQALGRVPVPVAGVDFLVASGYKWLLGTHGAAVTYLSPGLAERISLASAGWHSVRDIFAAGRFQSFELKPDAQRLYAGMPAFPAIYVLRRTIQFLLAAGVEETDFRLRPSVQRLRDGLEALGLDVLTPAGASQASGIVSFAHPRCGEIGRELERRDVAVWTGDGRVRASLHLYNGDADVSGLLAALRELPMDLRSGYLKARPDGTRKEEPLLR